MRLNPWMSDECGSLPPHIWSQLCGEPRLDDMADDTANDMADDTAESSCVQQPHSPKSPTSKSPTSEPMLLATKAHESTRASEHDPESSQGEGQCVAMIVFQCT